MHDAERQAVVRAAESWLGTPWHHRARIKGVGVDCGQMVTEVYTEAGLIEAGSCDPYLRDFYLHSESDQFRAAVEVYADPLPFGELPLPGDIVLFRFGRVCSHAAIVTEWPGVIHAYIPAKAVIRDDVMANSSLASRLAGVWRLRGW
jgi:cell wall-associated NlpC family hydrolase